MNTALGTPVAVVMLTVWPAGMPGMALLAADAGLPLAGAAIALTAGFAVAEALEGVVGAADVPQPDSPIRSKETAETVTA
ncbi:MAG: hypothetical protein ACHQ7M_17965 [Chloroflexota bacterium]